ncbi:MAG: hypothetical protein Q9227_009255 [Pyrenula ochraceoflavens]
MEYDYIIVGGGISGCVLASRLHLGRPDLKVLLIEAGDDVSDRPEVQQGSYARLLETDIDWGYTSVPQLHLNNRRLGQHAGKALGGGSVINACGWLRGDKTDYDAWGATMNDHKWSYDGFLPYFRKTEHHHNPKADPKIHGFDGPVITSSVSSSGRDYPLRETVQRAWSTVGVQRILDMNSGNPIGLGEMNDNRKDGKRQITPHAYSLEGVEVVLKTQVEKILMDSTGHVARGVQLLDGTQIKARREVVLSAGAYRTPQTLLLSGIGPSQELEEQGITCSVDQPEVGHNFHDHLVVSQWWKLREPELGLSMGHPKFGGANYEKGLPGDFVITMSTPSDGMRRALELDLDGKVPESHPMLSDSLSNIESYVVYIAANAADPSIPLDGSHITTSVCLMLPTSRGTIKLTDRDARSPPTIDPNYFATEADRFMMRWGLRKVTHVMLETNEGQKMVAAETTAEGKPSLTPSSPDEDLDDLVRRSAK